MRIQQMIIGMMLLLTLGVSHAGETRHFMGVYSDSYSDDELGGTSYQYGYDFSNLFSLEFDYSGVDVDSASTTLTSVESFASLMMRFNNRYESINTYFILGATAIAYTSATPIEESFTGVTYGVGIELYGSKNTAVSFTYTTTEFSDSIEIPSLDVTRIGLVHHFDFGKSSSRY